MGERTSRMYTVADVRYMYAAGQAATHSGPCIVASSRVLTRSSPGPFSTLGTLYSVALLAVTLLFLAAADYPD